MKYLRFVLFCVALTFSADYQKNSINVQGVASDTIEPNIAYFSIGVQIKNKNLDSAIVKTGEITEKLAKVFKKFKLDKNTAKVKEISIRENWNYVGRDRKLDGFMVKRMYRLTLKDLSILSDILYQAHKSGANELEDISFDHTNSKAIGFELLEKAVGDAKDKAKILAKSSGLKILHASVVSDSPAQNFSYQSRVHFDLPGFGENNNGRSLVVMSDGIGASAEEKYKGLFHVEPAMIVIDKTVWVTFKTEVDDAR